MNHEYPILILTFSTQQRHLSLNFILGSQLWVNDVGLDYKDLIGESWSCPMFATFLQSREQKYCTVQRWQVTSPGESKNAFMRHEKILYLVQYVVLYSLPLLIFKVTVGFSLITSETFSHPLVFQYAHVVRKWRALHLTEQEEEHLMFDHQAARNTHQTNSLRWDHPKFSKLSPTKDKYLLSPKNLEN